MQASLLGHFSACFTAPITTSSFSFDNIVIGHVEEGSNPFGRGARISTLKISRAAGFRHMTCSGIPRQ